MYRLASTPSGVPWATFARKMSPVEILGTARCAAMNSAWVPLPAPGGPTSTSLTRAPRCAAPLRPLAEEPFVVALHQLALDLFDGFQTDADDDQYRGTAEGEVLPVAADHVDEQVGQHRDDGQVHRAGQRDPAQDEVEVLGRGLTGPDTRDEAAV